ncbi:Clp protease N-terminal domain-containing protein [Actinocorallia populi]|uniref:Clp protease N-terminal domain-containing protein n=1 Tax=Actinocorallia populi TaxID=2079200 RepID=UPI000D09336F|nr:Clp protease N-terminal domain-containing protein [Actinocorallia populi]
MFERFTGSARAAVVQAQQEARALGHDRIEAGHLLLALTSVEGGAARTLDACLPGLDGLRARVRTEIDGLDPDVLASIGVDLSAVRRAAESAFGEGALDRGRKGRRGHLRFTREAKKVLELALRVAIHNGHRFISDGHILIALLMLPESAPVRALLHAGADLAAVKSTALQEIASEAA